jgi:predicted acylesterase/phospholipase RssA
MVALMQRVASRQALLDPTLPLTSFFATRKLTSLFRMLWGDSRIEDLWRPYFCISSNLTRAEPVVHQAGPIWQCLRASVALPGVFSPVLYQGDILVDGGVLNNFPLDVMRELCEGGTVIGINVSPTKDLAGDYRFGPSVSGWQVLMGRLPLSQGRMNPPPILSTLVRSLELNGVHRMRTHSGQALADLLIQPSVSNFGILDFSAGPQLVEVGYQAGREAVAQNAKCKT